MTALTRTDHSTEVAPEGVEKGWLLFNEFFLKDVSTYPSIATNIFWSAVWDANPCSLNTYDFSQKHVTILLHRKMPCFFPLAKKLESGGIRNVFTVEPKQTDADSVPLKEINTRINEIMKEFQSKGQPSVSFTLVGHSLGALVALKRIWRVEPEESIVFKRLISFAGRLKYEDNPFWWFCKGVRPEIEANYKAYEGDKKRAEIFTICGDRDGCVPEQSAHICQDKSLTVTGYGHGGVVFSEEAQDRVVELLKT